MIKDSPAFLSTSSQNAPTAVWLESSRKQQRVNTLVVMNASTVLRTTTLTAQARPSIHLHAQYNFILYNTCLSLSVSNLLMNLIFT